MAFVPYCLVKALAKVQAKDVDPGNKRALGRVVEKAILCVVLLVLVLEKTGTEQVGVGRVGRRENVSLNPLRMPRP